MKRKLQGIIAGALLIAAATPFAANAANAADTQFAIFMRNLEASDGAPVPTAIPPAPSDTSPRQTLGSNTRLQPQAPQKESYQFEVFENNLAQGSNPNYTPSEHAADIH